jgi:hypothetical protein
VLAALGSLTAAAAAPVVVLLDGTRLEVVAARVEHDLLIAELVGGGLVSYPLADVDRAASTALPAPPRPPAAGVPAGRPTTLGALARDLTLAVPADQDPARAGDARPAARGTLTIADLSPSATDPATAPEAADPDETAAAASDAVRRDVAELAAAWGSYQEALGELVADCQDYTTGTVSVLGRGSWIVERRITAECQDVVKRSLGRLGELERRHEQIWTTARRRAVAPGVVRDLLRAAGLADFRQVLAGERAWLEGLKA